MGAIADGWLTYTAAFADGITPDPNMWVDEWADEYMQIPKKSGAARPGKYRTDRTPMARGIMRALSPGHPCQRVIVMGASQMLKTQVGLNWISASIHQAPANILVLLPTGNVAKRVSNRLSATFEAVPELAARVAEPRSRDARNTLDTKEFDGGTLYIATAGSASNLAEIPARYIYGDEVDRWESNVDSEGDPVDLAANRTSSFGNNAKQYYSSSPLLEGTSRIHALFLEGDQQLYFIPCPHCGHMHVLEFDNLRANSDNTLAWMVCPECGAEIHEHHKADFLPRGEWRPTAAGDGLTASFHVTALYASPGSISWVSLKRQHDKAKIAQDRGDPEPMQVFTNTRLAKVWNASTEIANKTQLQARAEDYPLRIVPRGALVLTAAVDVQGNRLELKIEGWGEGMEHWVVDYRVLWGSPSESTVWQDLDRELQTPLYTEGGVPLAISATAIDTGGHAAQEVYDFCRLRRHRKILAIKGASRPGRPIIANKPSKQDVNVRGRTEKQGVELWLIGTDTAKDWLAARMGLVRGVGAMHFSRDLPEEYYTQMTAEKRNVRWRKGHAISEWVKSKADRNEAWDLSVYNLAAAYYLGLHRKQPGDWARLRRQVEPDTGDLFAHRPAPDQADSPEPESPGHAVQTSAPPPPQLPVRVGSVHIDLSKSPRFG